ncbi:MAG: FecR family protein [Candidatus Omnitrophota bacterium]
MNMSKAFSVVIMILAALVFVLPVFAQDASPKVLYAEGLVSVNLDGTKWVPAKTGMELQEESAIKTADESYCDVSLDGSLKNIISVGPNSEVSMGKYLERINVVKGRVFAKLKDLKEGQFEVQTPTAIAGARGTQWQTSTDGKTAKFDVKENTIYVQGLDKEGNVISKTDVSQGNTVSVDEEGFLGALRALTQQEEDELDQWAVKLEQSLGKRDCNDLLNTYQGASGNLYEQVLGCQAGISHESFAAAGGGLPSPDVGFPDQGITGGDITTTTFDEPPVEPPPIIEPPEEPPYEPPEEPPYEPPPEEEPPCSNTNTGC